MMGININCKHQDFIDQILGGYKLIETRDTCSLRPYIGQRVGLIETGKGAATLRGYATITGYVLYSSEADFRGAQDLHQVKPGSKYDIPVGGCKYGFFLEDVEACEPVKISSRGIVARQLY